jgi:3-phenylpropionate/trans-cinnamate dioxygenase ferredoxin subunit
MTAMTTAVPFVFPTALQAAGTADGPYVSVARIDDLPHGALLRVTYGDLDVLLAHTDAGIVAIEDRCPHMSAPLSAGQLEGCILACPLHRGTFDLRDGSVVVFPTTGGLDADGNAHEPWSPPGSPPKPPPADSKALARSLTRVRRIRYLPLTIVDGGIVVRLPR